MTDARGDASEKCYIDIDKARSAACQGPILACSVCGAAMYDDETSEGPFRFCPNCGRERSLDWGDDEQTKAEVARGICGADELREENATLRDALADTYAALLRACTNYGKLVHRYVTEESVAATEADLLEIRLRIDALGIEVG